MSGVWIPTLAGIARMVPIRDDAIVSDVGADWIVDAFTVPQGRVLALDWASLALLSGTAPSRIRITVIGTTAGGSAILVRQPPPAGDVPIFLTSTVWIEEDVIVRLQNEAGDGTTDMLWAFAGRLFDWQDVS